MKESEKKTIIFVIASLSSGGAERVLSTLSNEMVKNYNIVILTFEGIPPFYPLDNRISIIHCKDKILPTQNVWEALKINFFLLKKIKRVFRVYKANLAISFMTRANILTILAAKIQGIPVIISERTNPNKQNLPIFWKKIRKITYKSANYLVIQNKSIKTFFSNIINPDKIIIIANPIAPELSNGKESETKSNNILTVGRLISSKAHHILIKAFANTLNADWKLVLAGDGPERLSIEKLIKQLGLERKVVLLGNVKDVAKLYNTSKIFAFSSTFEGSPNALIEAMHFGLACISTDCPSGPSDFIIPEENGYLVPVNDIEKFSTKLNQLMDSEKLRESFGEKAIIAVEGLRVEQIVNEWEKLITVLIPMDNNS